MTNTFNKVLAVFLSVASIVFLGFTIAYTSGGTNWQSEMLAPDLDEYNFQISQGENPQWSVTGVGGKNVATVPANKLSDAIVRTRKDLESRQRAQLTEINAAIPNVEKRVQDLQVWEKADREALQRRETEAQQYLSQLNQFVLATSDRLTKKIQDTAKARTQAANRRKDVYRLQNEIEVTRTDRARLVELRRTLADELLRLQLTNESLRQRVQQSQGD